MRIIFAGTPEFSVATLEALLTTEHEIVAVYTQPDKVSGRGQHLHQSPVKQCALNHHIPVLQPKSLRNIEEQDYLKRLKPDLMVVVAYGLILPQAVLDIPQLGCINVHASILPRWRGASPIQHAILAGDKETGVSIMQMEAGLDTGPVFETSVCKILLEDTAQTLHDRLSLLGAKTLLKVLPTIETTVPVKQQEEKTCYAGKISKQDGQIDWNTSAWEIACKVRAFNPWPVAYFFVDGEYVRVWEGTALSTVELTEEIPSEATPGTIVKVSSQGIDVAVDGHTPFRITKLQLPNAKVVSVRDYLNARHSLLTEGKVLV